jgi:hypothetical protein
MAYITEYNLKKLLSDIDTRNLPSNLPISFDVALTRILSTPELKWLEGFRMLCMDPSFILDEKFQVIKAKNDTKTWASERNNEKPAYHHEYLCERLNSDYINFKIPVEIKGRGDKEIERFRKWFQENRKLLQEQNESSFILHLQVAFQLKNPPKEGSIIIMNSGVSEFSNDNLDDLKNRMNNILLESEEYRNSSPEISKEIRCWGYATHKHRDVKKEGTIIHKWHGYKSSLKSLMITYFRVKFNPECEFEGYLLDQLGFCECHSCQ